MPVRPMCLSNYRGIWLNPELLSALKCSANTDASSPSVICYGVASTSGVNTSAGIVESWKIDSLNLTKSAVYSATSSVVLDFNMPQNYLGRFLSMSGS
jgi:hypothetical protein